MTAVNDLLDRARKASGAPSDNALAGVLGIKRQTISNWRHGKAHPDAVACARIAALLNEPLARVLGMVGEERALSREEKQVWRRLAEAAVLALAFLPVASKADAGNARNPLNSGANSPGLYIM